MVISELVVPETVGDSSEVHFGVGTVVHLQTGLGVPGLQVEIHRPDYAFLACEPTDAQGRFRFPLEPGVPLDFRVTATGLSASAEGARMRVRSEHHPLVADFLLVADCATASRRARVRQVAADLLNPPVDNPMRMLSFAVRLGLLSALAESLDVHPDHGHRLLSDGRYLDLGSLPEGRFSLFEQREGAVFDFGVPDEEAYRDYLRGVFMLYAHQQALGFSGDLTQWRDLVHRQLSARFFQDFLNQDHTRNPLNVLLIPIVKRILTDAAFGFGVDPASIPAQGTQSARSYLDILVPLSRVTTEEFANRYRLPLGESDQVLSTPVLLSSFTLSRILGDTAQGPVEEKAITPQLNNFDGKPLLWKEVVGVAPFFLHYGEWLGRGRPFFGENHFSPRTQIPAGARGQVWLNQETEEFLTYHSTSTSPVSSYQGLFGSIEEVRRSAAFLLALGRADAKLLEFLAAFDQGEFRTALRLLDEAERELAKAKPHPLGSENWEPEQAGNGRQLSFAARRALPVTTIGELVGDSTPDLPKGFEPFFRLKRPLHVWDDLRVFLEGRGLAARLARYLRAFVVPLMRTRTLMELGDPAAAIAEVAKVSGFYVGIAELDTPTGAAYEELDGQNKRAVHQGRTLPYTARLSYDDSRKLLPPKPFSILRFSINGPFPEMKPEELHPIEVRYVALLQADAMLQWAETLYRSCDPSNLERARELYKGVVLLHGEDPGTMAFSARTPLVEENPRTAQQLRRARLGLFQIEAGLNFYGYPDTFVPTLRFNTLIDAARRWSGAAKGAQNDYLAYLSRIEQLDLDMLAAQAQLKKARAAAQATAEQIEIAEAGVAAAQRLVREVERQITAKQEEIADAESFFGQYSAFLGGLKNSVASVVEVGAWGNEGATTTGAVSDTALREGIRSLGSSAASGVGVPGGLSVIGIMGAFVVLSTIQLQGMADAAAKRDKDLRLLINESLTAAKAALQVQQRLVTIATLQASIAAADVAYASDLVTYQAERFLNRDLWSALAGIARGAMSRQLDLAAQAGWLAERALAYETGRPLDIIRFDYPNPRLRDLGGVDRLMLDLTELEAVRVCSARLSLPIKRSYSLARDLPIAFGALKSTGRCTFSLDDADLLASHPGTYAHRIRAVTVGVEAPGTAVLPAGMLVNRGVSYLRRDPDGPGLPLVRFEDALPISDFQLRNDMTVHGLPNESLLAFEGSGFATTWELEFPVAANPALGRLSDVIITFDLRAEYRGPAAEDSRAAGTTTRAILLSALSLDTKGLSAVRSPAASARVSFDLAEMLANEPAKPPVNAKISNLAVLLPGINSGSFPAKLVLPSRTIPFTIRNGVATSNAAHLSDGVPAHAQPLNAAAGTDLGQRIEIGINHPPGQLDLMRDLLLWVEYQY